MRRAVIEPPVELSRRLENKENHCSRSPYDRILGSKSHQCNHKMMRVTRFAPFRKVLKGFVSICLLAGFFDWLPLPPGYMFMHINRRFISRPISRITKLFNYSRWKHFPAPTEAINLHFSIINLVLCEQSSSI